jgi:diguanylate cyclase (GGDEF)-like protein
MTTPSSSANHKVLLYVEPNPERGRELQRALEPRHVDVIVASNYMSAISALSRQTIDVLIANQTLADGSGATLLRFAERHHPGIGCMLMLEADELAGAIDDLSTEAWEYLVRDRAGAFARLLPAAAMKSLAAHQREQERAGLLQALTRAQTLADLAAENCDHGLAIFDADMRLQLCNAGFLEFFGYAPEMGASGTRLRDMLAFNLRRGDYGNHNDGTEIERRLRRLCNGRNFRLRRPSRGGHMHEVEGRHLPDGGLVMRFFQCDATPGRNAYEEANSRQHAVTGLPNADLFRALLAHQSRRASRSGYNGAALMLMQLNGMDDLGHQYGNAARDSVMKEAGRRLSRAVRECDVVACLDQESFGVLLIDVNTQENAEIVAGKLMRAVSPAYLEGAAEMRVNVSVGIVFQPTELHTEDELLRIGEAAMKEAEKAGKNNFRFAS